MTSATTVGTQSVGTGPHALKLLLSEDQFAGDVAFTISVNNEQIGGVYAVQALHSQNENQGFVFNGDWGADPKVTITFVNPASDAWVGNGNTRQLYVDDVSYDGSSLVLPADSLTADFPITSSMTLDTKLTADVAAAADTTVAPGGLGSLLNLSGYHLTYDDEFNTMPTMSPVAGQAQYDTTLDGFPNNQGMRILYNGDQQYYTDSTTGSNPFSIANGGLVISATYVGAGNTPSGGGASGPSYTSGQITTEGSFSQKYGYFEMRAQLPQGPGMWPAFWLLPTTSYLGGGWNPELDVMEAFGSVNAYGEGGPTQSHWAIHTAAYSPGGWGTLPDGGNAYTGYHTYGTLWTPETIGLYLDGVEIGQIPTPADFSQRMYMIANLAVGGYWPGNATGENTQMSVDYLRAYSSNDAIPSVALQTVSSPDGSTDPGLYGATALNMPLAVSITALALAQDTGASAADHITNNGSVTFKGTVQGAAGGSVEIYDNGVDLGTATITGATWSFATTLGAGSHKLSATARDITGKTGSVESKDTITVVTTPPSVAITSAAQTTTGLAISGTLSGMAGTTVKLYSGATALATANVQSGGGWSAIVPLSAGTYNLTAQALDLAGNVGVSANKSAAVQSNTTGNKLTLAVSESAYKGDAQFTVSVDGKQVGGTMTTSVSHDTGNANVFVLTGNWGKGKHDVQLKFINDAYGGSPDTDRNLFVNSISYDNVTYGGTTASLFGNGAKDFNVGGNSIVGTAPADTVTLHLAEDAWAGDATYQVLLDGKVIATPQQVTASRAAGAWQDMSFSGNFGAGSHTVGVEFLNDAYGNSDTQDRNLHVNGIDVNGAHYGAGVTSLWRDGTANFTFTTTH